MDAVIAEQIAWNLYQRFSSPLAFIPVQDKIFFSTVTSTSPIFPASPVTELIQGIWRNFPEQARSILRKRIYSTTPPTEMCWGMVKVAAKCLTPDVIPRDHQLPIKAPYEEIQPEPLTLPTFDPQALLREFWFKPHPPQTDQDFLELAAKLIPPTSGNGALYTRDRAVGCLLVLPQATPKTKPQILAWARNTNARNRTLHAEVNLLQNFFATTGKKLPPGACLYTTLKPCKMCAGMLWHYAEEIRTLRVVYAEDDPGPNARSTVLEQGTFQRRRAVGPQKDLIELKIQEQLPRN